MPRILLLRWRCCNSIADGATDGATSQPCKYTPQLYKSPTLPSDQTAVLHLQSAQPQQTIVYRMLALSLAMIPPIAAGSSRLGRLGREQDGLRDGQSQVLYRLAPTTLVVE
jgi:hypothetical protein